MSFKLGKVHTSCIISPYQKPAQQSQVSLTPFPQLLKHHRLYWPDEPEERGTSSSSVLNYLNSDLRSWSYNHLSIYTSTQKPEPRDVASKRILLAETQ